MFADHLEAYNCSMLQHTGLWYEPEELFATGDRCAFRWVGHRTDKYGNAEHYRGVDILRVRNGKVAEKLVYTKR